MTPLSRRFERTVSQILTASDVGLRWADNIGPEVRLVWRGSAVSVPVALPSSPAYIVVRATNRTTSASECGCRIVWAYDRGTLTVSGLDVSAPSDEYDVTLGIMVR